MNAIIKKVNKDLDNQDGILSKELIINTKNVPLPLTENNGIILLEVNKIELIDGKKSNRYTRDNNGAEIIDLSFMNEIPTNLKKIIEDGSNQSINKLEDTITP